MRFIPVVLHMPVPVRGTTYDSEVAGVKVELLPVAASAVGGTTV